MSGLEGSSRAIITVCAWVRYMKDGERMWTV